LGIVGIDIEIKRIFSFTRIFTNFRKYHLQIKNLENLIFCSKKWPNDLKIGCKSPFNLVEFLEKNIDLEEKLEEFERHFENDEIVEV